MFWKFVALVIYLVRCDALIGPSIVFCMDANGVAHPVNTSSSKKPSSQKDTVAPANVLSLAFLLFFVLCGCWCYCKRNNQARQQEIQQMTQEIQQMQQEIQQLERILQKAPRIIITQRQEIQQLQQALQILAQHTATLSVTLSMLAQQDQISVSGVLSTAATDASNPTTTAASGYTAQEQPLQHVASQVPPGDADAASSGFCGMRRGFLSLLAQR